MSTTARTAAIVGVGIHRVLARVGPLGARPRSCRVRRRARDAGLAANEVDGIGSFMVMHDSVKCQAVATTLAVPGLRWSVDLDLGGQAPCHLVGLAATAIATGQAESSCSSGR